MKINMNDSRICSLKQIKEFLKLDQNFNFKISNKKDKYNWVEQALGKFRYHSLKKKKEKMIVRKYIEKVTGLSKVQLTRLTKKQTQVIIHPLKKENLKQFMVQLI